MLEMAAQLWARFDVLFCSEWPWRLLPLADPHLAEQAKLEICESFFEAPICELNEAFSAPLREELKAVSYTHLRAHETRRHL
eukprot:12199254-Prorocentrum_lima.AAC.1